MSKIHTRLSLFACAVVFVPVVAWWGRAFPLRCTHARFRLQSTHLFL